MCDVSVLTIRRLSGRHRDEETLLTLDHLDIVDDELIIEGDGDDRLHLAFLIHLADPYICYLHASILLLHLIPCIFFYDDLDVVRRTDVGRVGTNRVAALDDTVLDNGIIANVYIIQDDRVLDHAVVSDINLTEQNGILDGTVDDAATCENRVTHVTVRVVLRRRIILELRVDTRQLLEEELADVTVQEIHVGLIVRLDGRDVCPVGVDLITIDALYVLIAYQDITDEIGTILIVCLLEELDQLTTTDDVDTAGDGVRVGRDRFLLEVDDPAVLVHLYAAEAGSIRVRLHGLHHYGDICLLVDVMLEHLCVVELVDAVAGSDDDIWLMRLLQKIEVLIQCVGGATEPVAVLCGDGRCINIQTTLLTTEIPPLRGGRCWFRDLELYCVSTATL